MGASGTQAAPAWNGYDVYLFDIDGTLLNCADAVHYFAFCEGLGRLAGRPLNLDGIVTHGNVDIGILRDALRLAKVPESAWRPKLTETCAFMCEFVTERMDDLRITVLPAVREALSYLQARGAVLGVATGNLQGIGRAKLARCGLLEYFTFGGYSDGLEHRRDVFRLALAEARRQAGNHANVCIVGDTIEDVRSAQAIGLDVIAVATGIYSIGELMAESPTRCASSMAELLLV